MAAPGRVFHWKHGWIPLDHAAADMPTSVAPKTGKRKEILTVRKNALKAQPDLMKEIEKNGGFSFDPHTGGLLEVGKAHGFAVAIPGTETIVGEEKPFGEDITRAEFAQGIAAVIMKNRKAIDNGAIVGGWYSPERNQYMVELTNILPPSDKQAAINEGKKRNQEAIFDLSTGETIVTGGTGDLPNQKSPELVSTFDALPTPEERAAAKYYTGPGYKPLNGDLRAGRPLSPSVAFYMKQLDAAFAKSTTTKPMTVHRGVQSGSWLPEGLAPGTPIVDRGYVSTAVHPSSKYPGDTHMIINVPAGAHALDLNGQMLTHHASEKELLLPRNTKLRVISDVRTGASRTITAEVVI